MTEWINTDERKPEDGQKVLGYWGSMKCAETVTYHASDSPVDGIEWWANAWDNQTDAPDLWTPWKEPQ